MMMLYKELIITLINWQLYEKVFSMKQDGKLLLVHQSMKLLIGRTENFKSMMVYFLRLLMDWLHGTGMLDAQWNYIGKSKRSPYPSAHQGEHSPQMHASSLAPGQIAAGNRSLARLKHFVAIHREEDASTTGNHSSSTGKTPGQVWKSPLLEASPYLPAIVVHSASAILFLWPGLYVAMKNCFCKTTFARIVSGLLAAVRASHVI